MGAQKFLKNQWYVSARANELNRKPLARTICALFVNRDSSRSVPPLPATTMRLPG